MLEDGRLHLSGLGKLAAHLTEENCEEEEAMERYRRPRDGVRETAAR